ncbi:MAG: START domain-containing protein [Halioglobus sp.]
MRQSKTISARVHRTACVALAAMSLALSPAITAASSTVPSGDDWTARKNDQSLQLYTREVAGSDFIAVKVTALVNASVEKVAYAFGNGDGCSGWQAMCKTSTVVEVVSDSERYIHLVLDLPWPLSDRDMVIHSTSTIDPETDAATMHMASAADKIPLQDYVRARSNGRYTVKTMNAEQVELTYIIHTELGGNVSPATVNSRLISTTFEDIKRLVELAESDSE